MGFGMKKEKKKKGGGRARLRDVACRTGIRNVRNIKRKEGFVELRVLRVEEGREVEDETKREQERDREECCRRD